MRNSLKITLASALIGLPVIASAQEDTFTAQPFSCFDDPMFVKARFVDAGSNIQLLWDAQEEGAGHSNFVELVAENTSGDLIFNRRGTEPYVRVENYGVPAEMRVFRINSDLTNFEYCTEIAFTPAPPVIDTYVEYIEHMSGAGLSTDELIQAVASKSLLWGSDFLTEAEQRSIAEGFNQAEDLALETYAANTETRLLDASGNADATATVFSDIERVLAGINSRDFSRELQKLYEDGHSQFAQVSLLDGTDPLANAVTSQEAFCRRLDSPLGVRGGRGQLVRASGIPMGFWNEDLRSRYLGYATACNEGPAFVRNLSNEMQANDNAAEIFNVYLVEYERLMSVPLTLAEVRGNNWLRMESRTVGGTSINAASLDRFSDERLPARRQEAVPLLRDELHTQISTVGDMPLAQYQQRCTALMGETRDRSELRDAVFEGCDEIVETQLLAHLKQLAENEPRAVHIALQNAPGTIFDRDTGGTFCSNRVYRNPSFERVDQQMIVPIFEACFDAFVSTGDTELLTKYQQQVDDILSSPQTLSGLQDNNWFVPEIAEEVDARLLGQNVLPELIAYQDTARIKLSEARTLAISVALDELRTASELAQSGGDTAKALMETCDSLPSSFEEPIEAMQAVCSAARLSIETMQAQGACAAMWAGTIKTDGMQAGTLILPRVTGGESIELQSYFCQFGRGDLEYEIVQDVGFFSTDTFLSVDIGHIDGLVAPARLTAQIVPSSAFEDVFELSNPQVVGQAGNSLAVQGNEMFILACFVEPTTCQLDR